MSSPPASRARNRAVLLLFGGTLLVSATLLFLVEPMVGKMILPLLGGSPSVWNTCMLFFQAALLAGYFYSHALTRRLAPRSQAIIHGIVLLTPFLVLPLNVTRGGLPSGTENPVSWLLLRLLLTVGLPFFVVSTTTPLLQKWFGSTEHPAARDPYFLYATSNLGSLLALIGYPLLFEPAFTLPVQSRIWTAGYAGMLVLAAACIAVVIRHGRKVRAADVTAEVVSEDIVEGQPPAATAPLTAVGRAMWVLAAFIPSSLMLGVTTHVTTNVAAVPLLWVIPLALYLLTFILAFARTPLAPYRVVSRIAPFVLLPLMPLVFLDLSNRWLAVLAHFLLFFVVALLCHSRLAASRPHPRHLTEYYLWISIGGVLGGVFNAIVAPVVFQVVAEYSLVLALAGFMLRRHPKSSHTGLALGLDFGLPAAVGLAGLGLTRLAPRWTDQDNYQLLIIYAAPALAYFAFNRRPLRFGLCFAVLVGLAASHAAYAPKHLLFIERNFYGVKRVVDDPYRGMHKLVHGDILHGTQFTDEVRRRHPTSYYYTTGPIGDIFMAYSGAREKKQVAIIGLGSGTLAAWAKPGQVFTFYDIDPAVEKIARNPKYFTYLSDCLGEVKVILGDGRLQLAKAPDGLYGLIILDVFSSDAIPVHFLTEEAMRIYLKKLAPGGAVVFHVSNRYLDLAPVVANLAGAEGLVCYERSDLTLSETDRAEGKTASHWMIVARSEQDIEDVIALGSWEPVAPRPDVRPWTDNYSNILGLLRD